MTKLSNAEARELFKNSTSGKGSKIRVDPGVLEKVVGKPVVNVSPASKVLGPIVGDKQPEGPKKAKYGNRKVPDPESTKPFDSILESKHGKEYRLMAKIGEIISVTRQPRFHLQGGVVYIADFLILHNDHSVEVVDSKGVETPDFKNKVKLFREKHPNLKLTIRHK